jgi:hypothetical protein
VSDAALPFGPAELAKLTGTDQASAAAAFAALRPPGLRYRPLPPAERGKVIADIEDTIDNRPLRVVGTDDPQVWEKGWAELAEQLKDRPITFESLRPQYFHAGVPCRLFGELVQPLAPEFEYWLGLCVRYVVFREFLSGWNRIVEFGCGTGINLLVLSKLAPAAQLAGCDWASASPRILQRMAEQTGCAIEGHRFNMLTASGEGSGPLGATTAVLTVHALEQLGPAWGPFLDYIHARHPGLCLHLEPLLELYDPASPLDELARRYHEKRNYLRGFLPTIRDLAARGQAEILAIRRIGFGGLYHQAYSVLAWRPATHQG